MNTKSLSILLTVSLLALGLPFTGQPVTAQATKSPSANSQRVATLRDWVAYLQAGQAALNKNQPDKALYYIQLSEACARKIPGPEGIAKRRESLKMLATLCTEMGRHGQASEYIRQAREISVASYRPSGDIVIDLNAQAGILKKQGKYAESEQKYQQAIAALGAARKETADAACVHDNLGLVYQEQKRFDKAIIEHQAAYNIYHKLVGDNHKDTAYCQSNLAEAYMGLKDYAKAEPLIIAAKSTLEKTEGSQSPATASLLDNLATLYTRTNRLTEAEDLQRRAIVIIEKYHGHFSADTAISMNNLATTYSLEGKNDEAKRTSLEACAIAQKALGPNHPYTRRCLRVLDGILGKGLKQEPGVAPTPATSEVAQ